MDAIVTWHDRIALYDMIKSSLVPTLGTFSNSRSDICKTSKKAIILMH